MNEKEYEKICTHIINMSHETDKTFNRTGKLMVAEELLDWLNHNGGCVLIKEDKKRLKTKDKVICTYMTKWGIKFQVIKEFKYHNVSYVKIKMLTKYKLNQGDD